MVVAAVDEADEHPLAKMDDPLGHFLGKVHQRYLLIVWGHALVSEDRVIDYPTLRKRPLWQFKFLMRGLALVQLC